MAYEERTFTRRVSYSNLTSSMVLVTAIARPERLHRFLPQNVTDTFYFPDHHYFSKKELEDILYHSGATSLLVTYKDYVKMSDFELPLSLINLDLHVNDELLEAVHSYVASNAKYVLGV
jgi:tetraacyldisaccharide 4'-kinase